LQVIVTMAAVFFYCVWFVCLICMGIFTALKGMVRAVKALITQDIKDVAKSANYISECVLRIINQ
ncbi:MAG: hypothetical protein NC078_11885, partial [Ruminococcus sp.]|nr:hypothetical protein [Ruminococcus sp.]